MKETKMKTVTVYFTARYNQTYTNKSYDYIVEDSVQVTAGDHAVVHNGSEFAIVKVESVKNGVSAKASKTLVAVLTQDTMREYAAMNEKLKEQKAMFARLEQLLAQESENNKYRLLAASNAEAAKILEALGIK
jgi:hypothetical protein